MRPIVFHVGLSAATELLPKSTGQVRPSDRLTRPTDVDKPSRSRLASRPGRGHPRPVPSGWQGKRIKHATLAFAGCLVGLASSSSLAAGELRGRILAENKAVSGATVSAVPFESPFEEARREARAEKPPAPVASVTTRPDGFVGLSMATSDSNGRFALEDLEPRPYQVSFQKAAYQAETRELTPAEQSDVVIEPKRGEGVGVVAKDGIYSTPLRTLVAACSTQRACPLSRAASRSTARARVRFLH
jgi:hypothetical protein